MVSFIKKENSNIARASLFLSITWAAFGKSLAHLYLK